MKDSKIQWTDHTFNPWRGCTKVSDGCKHCYAEQQSLRNTKTLGVWGANGTRVVASDSMWREPLRWDKEARASGVRAKVFCASIADVFEGFDTMPESAHDAVMQARKRLGKLILDTPNLDWLLVTKRPESILSTARDMWVRFNDEATLPTNVWVGVSVENQLAADTRIPLLLKVPARVRFLSMEPLLEAVDIDPPTCPYCLCQNTRIFHNEDGPYCLECGSEACFGWWLDPCASEKQQGINWVIVGGESGPNARVCDVEWIQRIVGQCKESGVPVFVKQLGSRPIDSRVLESVCASGRVHYRRPPGHPDFEQISPWYTVRPAELRGMGVTDPKGGDMDQWPAELRVRETP